MNGEMMTLRQLMDAIERKTFLETHVKNMQKRIDEKKSDCDLLKSELEREEADVLELQTGGIHAFFKTVFRDRNEILEKEKIKAAQAGAKYEMAITDLAKMLEELDGWKAELTLLEGCEEAFRMKYDARKKELEEAGNEAAQRILRAEKQLAEAKGRLKEIEEAERAAKSALSQVELIEQDLCKAETLGFSDMLGNDFAGLAKRAYLEKVEQMLPELQRRLRRFSNELEDVTLNLDQGLEIGDSLKFADWFFDSVFVDWEIQRKIHNFQSKIESMKNRIQCIVKETLELLRSAEECKIQKLEQEIDEQVISE